MIYTKAQDSELPSCKVRRQRPFQRQDLYLWTAWQVKGAGKPERPDPKPRASTRKGGAPL
jgi:hypothetical protein